MWYFLWFGLNELYMINPGGLMVDVGISASEMGVDNSGGDEHVELGDG